MKKLRLVFRLFFNFLSASKMTTETRLTEGFKQYLVNESDDENSFDEDWFKTYRNFDDPSEQQYYRDIEDYLNKISEPQDPEGKELMEYLMRLSLELKPKIREAYWEAHPTLRLFIEEPEVIKELILHKKYSFDDNEYNKIKKSFEAEKVLKENIMYIL